MQSQDPNTPMTTVTSVCTRQRRQTTVTQNNTSIWHLGLLSSVLNSFLFTTFALVNNMVWNLHSLTENQASFDGTGLHIEKMTAITRSSEMRR